VSDGLLKDDVEISGAQKSFTEGAVSFLQKRWGVACAVVTLGAIIVRCLHVWAAFYSPTADMIAYLRSADALFRSVPRNEALFTTFFPPGYPLWLVLAMRVLGLTLMKPVLYAQAVIGGMATAFLINAVGQIYHPRAGLVAGVLYALYLPFVYSTALLMSEAIVIPLLVFVLWAGSRFWTTHKLGWAVSFGAVLGAAVCVRTNVIAFAPVCALSLLVGPRGHSVRRRLRHTAGFVLGFALVVAPWVIRNSLLEGRPLFLAANTGMNLYQGNNPTSHGGWPYMTLPGLYTEFIPSGGSPAERDRQYAQQAWEFARSHPAYELFYLIPDRLEVLFGSSQGLWPWTWESPGGIQDYPFGPFLYIPLLDMHVIYVLAALGVLLRARIARWVLPLTWVSGLLLLVIVHGNVRFRIPLDVLALAPAAAACARVLMLSNWTRTLRLMGGAFLCVILGGSFLLWIQTGGRDLLQDPEKSTPLSPTAMAMHGSEIAFRGRTNLPLFLVRVQPGWAPRYLLHYEYRIEPQGSGEPMGPDIRYEFFNEAGTTVTLPIRGGGVLSARHRLNRYQETTGTAWHVITVPALARRMELRFVNDVEGTVTLSKLRLRGPVWGYH